MNQSARIEREIIWETSLIRQIRHPRETPRRRVRSIRKLTPLPRQGINQLLGTLTIRSA